MSYCIRKEVFKHLSLFLVLALELPRGVNLPWTSVFDFLSGTVSDCLWGQMQGGM